MIPLQMADQRLARISPIQWACWMVLIAAGVAIRIRAAINDLWLDEIWSLTSVRGISSPLEVFTRIHLDNNHYLNSLWMYLFRDHGDWIGYRVPAILAGLACMALAGIIGQRRNAAAGWIALFLVAFSYVEILYSSEARGYSEVVFFSFAAYYALKRYFDQQKWQFALAFAAMSIFGFLADLVFLNFYCAAVVWSAWRFSRLRLGTRRFIDSMVSCHLAPALFCLVLYAVDVSRIRVGGGTEASLPERYAESLAWLIGLGMAQGVAIMLAASLTVAALCIAALWILWREKNDAVIFFVGVIAVMPLAFVIAHHSNVIYVRYFIVGMSFGLVLISIVLAAICKSGWLGRIFCAVLMAVYFLLNSIPTMALFKEGRGHYADAVRYIIEHTKGPNVTIGSDHDLRVSLVLRFYVDQTSGDKTVNYYPVGAWPAKGPEWVIRHKESFDSPTPPEMVMTDRAGNVYKEVKTFPTAPLSGLHWFIYHNTGTNYLGSR